VRAAVPVGEDAEGGLILGGALFSAGNPNVRQLLASIIIMSTLKRAIFVCASILVLQVLGRLVFLVPTTRSARIQDDRPWSDFMVVVEEPGRQSADSVDVLALFYNVFVPVVDEESDGESNDMNNHTVHALEIVREHLMQMGTLFNHMQSTNRTRQARLTVHFVTIGNPATALAIRQMCQSPLACLHAGHYDAGFEEVTLQALYEYCADHSHARIIYLHNKGSFHPDFVGAGRKNISQNAWRRHGTDGAMHPDCLDPPDPRCNMCGLYVEVVPVIRQPYVLLVPATVEQQRPQKLTPLHSLCVCLYAAGEIFGRLLAIMCKS
jgi:hypothetical protein